MASALLISSIYGDVCGGCGYVADVGMWRTWVCGGCGGYYIGHNYTRHTYTGHNYIGHNYIGHNYLGHNNCIGHRRTGRGKGQEEGVGGV